MAAKFAGKYEYTKHENFDKYLTSIGIPEDKVKAFAAATKKPCVEIIVNGDQVTIKRTGGFKDHEITFTLGKEYSEELFGHAVKAITTQEGSKMKTLSSSERGQTEILTELVGNDLVYTITDLKNNVSSKRFFKKL